MNTPRQQPPRAGSSNQQADTKMTGSQKGPVGAQSVPRSTSAAAAKTPAAQNAPERASGSEAPLQPSISEDPGEAVRALGRETSSAASSLKSDLEETAKAASRAAQAQASAFAADVGHELNKAGEAQKARGAEAMQGFARAISSAASELENQSPAVARCVRDAAKQVDSLSSNIRGRSVTELMQAATDLARSQPAVFFAGAMAAGFALSRFLKSSAGDNDAPSASRSNVSSSTPGGAPSRSFSGGGSQPSMPRGT
jgi:vacuolar-type H+-ATPase subunit E/Vma4